jgi:putative tricarboxylic transport membrane protein
MRSTAIGSALGACPGIGGVVSAFVSYAAAKRASTHPETFGHGELEGVAAPEAGNNATNGPTLVPMLTLGIPGDSSTALLLGAFMAQGLRPGPQLMQEQGALVYGLLMTMVLANILFLILGYLAIPIFSKVINMKKALLLPVICIFAFAGSYVFRSDPFDLLVLVFFGILGYIARKLHFDVSPMVMAFILGPILEFSVGQTLTMTEGSLVPWLFNNRPIAFGIVMIIPILALVFSVKAFSRWRRNKAVRLFKKGGVK